MMKKLYFLILGGGKVKISYLLLAFLFATTTAATAEVLLNENFEYEAGNLYNQGGWVKFGTQAEKPIQVINDNLIFSNYQSEAIGKMIKADCEGNHTGNQDLHKAFTAKTSGTLYLSALVSIQKVLGDQFFLCFDGATSSSAIEDGKSTSNYWRLFVSQGTTESKFKFGLGKNKTTPTVTTTEEYDLNKTYLIILKYEFIEGATNDNFSLFINQIDAAEPTPTITTNAGTDATATINGNAKNLGIGGVAIMQNGSETKPTTPSFTIDAIRVATTWAELFPSATPEPKPEPEPDPTKPVISAPESIEFGSSYYVLTGESYDVKITVKGTDLEDDVTFASTCDQVTLSAASATKEQVMSADGFELTLTLKATGATCDPKLQIASTNATTVEVPITWTVLTTIDVADLAELRAKAATVNLEGEPVFRITNPVVVSYQDGSNYIYLQDDKGGIRMQYVSSILSTTTLPTGTKIAAGLLGTVSDNVGYEFIPSRDITIDGTATVNAVTATLAEIDADKAAYADRLVRVEHVTFNNFGKEVFGANVEKDTIIQEGYKAALRLFSSVTDIAGQTIPARATVVGISTSTSKLLIAPRGWSDITGESSTVAIDKATAATICYTHAGTLIVENAATDIAVYNLTGICVAKAAAAPRITVDLPQGVYAVKMGGQTYKVVVK